MASGYWALMFRYCWRLGVTLPLVFRFGHGLIILQQAACLVKDSREKVRRQWGIAALRSKEGACCIGRTEIVIPGFLYSGQLCRLRVSILKAIAVAIVLSRIIANSCGRMGEKGCVSNGLEEGRELVNGELLLKKRVTQSAIRNKVEIHKSINISAFLTEMKHAH